MLCRWNRFSDVCSIYVSCSAVINLVIVLRLCSLKIGKGGGFHFNILTNLHATNVGNSNLSSQINNFSIISDS